jgi:hypothetical protein
MRAYRDALHELMAERAAKDKPNAKVAPIRRRAELAKAAKGRYQ